ncbi:MAG: hypothetical protein C0394_09415 [Syntrophus sp. (in: bacteria)]|nr:hypothetical protein [Syntrophus sp. (in: bacteria)]
MAASASAALFLLAIRLSSLETAFFAQPAIDSRKKQQINIAIPITAALLFILKSSPLSVI